MEREQLTMWEESSRKLEKLHMYTGRPLIGSIYISFNLLHFIPLLNFTYFTLFYCITFVFVLIRIQPADGLSYL